MGGHKPKGPQLSPPPGGVGTGGGKGGGEDGRGAGRGKEEKLGGAGSLKKKEGIGGAEVGGLRGWPLRPPPPAPEEGGKRRVGAGDRPRERGPQGVFPPLLREHAGTQAEGSAVRRRPRRDGHGAGHARR